MAKILVTGGCGYIGSHTIVDLIQHGYEVISVDNNSRSDATVMDGIEQITGLTMPIFEKRRMQHGAAAPAAFSTLFPVGEQPYRRAFLDLYAQ